MTTFSVEMPVGATGLMSKEQVAFVGQPEETLSVTGSVKPLSEVTVTVELPDWPGVNVIDEGLDRKSVV